MPESLILKHLFFKEFCYIKQTQTVQRHVLFYFVNMQFDAIQSNLQAKKQTIIYYESNT